ncbi:hypothetical protein OVA13_02655 [Pseudoxanthomonas sp. SL93]|uniref:hypothetical protein n=1 Tax=Pseudoxanthomonas sp. SL93 TaxID=2995142 RepID=UPI00226D64E9|nr:hypothetical protein [Pseudoxanthomonas sp. SL93]WAC63710.1 hypothetical protein OVA13_02655 [Pseudoxanthomonas sp. SL93]
MSQYRILWDETLIGYSALESGDPPMGVAFGKFVPLPGYEAVQARCIASREMSQEHLPISATQSDGQLIPALGVSILDFSIELGASEIEVHVIGIGYPLYEELFPNQVAAYAKQFG